MLKMLQISSLVRYSSFPMVGRCVSIRISTARMALTMSRYSSLNAALSRVMISSGMLQAFYQILFQEMPDVVVPERRHSLQKTLKVRLQLFIGARFHKDAIHNAEGLGDFCVKDVQDNPSLQKTIPMSAPDRSSPLKGKNDRLSRPEKGLQKRVNLMQQKTNSDLSRHYLPRQLRHLILQEYLSGVKTARQLSEEHGIPMSTIHKMGQRWKAKNSCSFVSTPNPYPIMSRVTSEEASELLSENKALRRRLEEALLRLEGYEIMGDILQEEYGIDLLKKSAAGQSSVSKKDTQQ